MKRKRNQLDNEGGTFGKKDKGKGKEGKKGQGKGKSKGPTGAAANGCARVTPDGRQICFPFNNKADGVLESKLYFCPCVRKVLQGGRPDVQMQPLRKVGCSRAESSTYCRTRQGGQRG